MLVANKLKINYGLFFSETKKTPRWMPHTGLIFFIAALLTSPQLTIAAHPMVSVGGLHTAIVKADGSIWTWGANDSGQLGNQLFDSSDAPVQAASILTAIDVAAGENHNAAIDYDGKIWTWGNNAFGQLGNGNTLNSSSPTHVPGFSAGIAVAAGANHSLALKSDKTLWAWGNNESGQLGDGTPVDRDEPVKVANLTNITNIAAGEDHSLARKSDGTVWAWGNNFLGQLGDKTNINRDEPVNVSTLSGAMSVTAGARHSLAIIESDGTVWAWGQNDFGQLGDGTTDNKNTPINIQGISGIIALAAGRSHTLALKEDGSLLAWGANDFGQLGDGTNVQQRSDPTTVVALTDVAAIAAGDSTSFAIKNNGTIWAWGENLNGLWDSGETNFSNTPVEIADIDLGISIQFASSTYSVDENAGITTVGITRHGVTAEAASVEYTAINGTATAGDDYTAVSNSINFAEGETEASFDILIAADSFSEIDETILLELSNPSPNSSLAAPSSATMTIIQEARSAIQFSSDSYTQKMSGEIAAITIERIGISEGTATVTVSTSDGTAEKGRNYIDVTQTVEFLDGETIQTVDVGLIFDEEQTSDETVILTLSNPGNGTILGEQYTATLTIEAKKPSVLELSAASYSVMEDEEKIEVTVVRSDSTDGEVTVDYATSGGTAVEGQDFEGTSGTLTFADGDSENKTIVIPITNDIEPEDLENLYIILSNPTSTPSGLASLGENSSATISIGDLEAGEFSFALASYEVGENDAFIDVKIVRSPWSQGEAGTVTVKVDSSDATAKTGDDYSAISQVLTFGDADPDEQTVTIAIKADALAEPTETFKLTLSDPTKPSTLGNRSSTIIAIIDDEPTTFKFSADEYSTSEEKGGATITIERIGYLNEAASVNFSATSQDSALPCNDIAGNACNDPLADYIPVSKTIDFPAGTSKQEIELKILTDTRAEEDETITLQLFDPTNGLQLDSAQLTITKENQAGAGIISFESAVFSAAEINKSVTVKLLREKGKDGEVSVLLETISETGPGIADAGMDYESYSEIVVFPNGVEEMEVEIILLDDAIAEDEERFAIKLSNEAGGAALGETDRAEVAIEAHSEPGIFSFEKAVYSAKENTKSVDVAIIRYGTDEKVTATVAITAALEFSGTIALSGGRTLFPETFYADITFPAQICKTIMSFRASGVSMEHRTMNAENRCEAATEQAAEAQFYADGLMGENPTTNRSINSEDLIIFPPNDNEPNEDFTVTLTLSGVEYTEKLSEEKLALGEPSLGEQTAAEIIIKDPEDNKDRGEAYPYRLKSNGTCFISSFFE